MTGCIGRGSCGCSQLAKDGRCRGPMIKYAVALCVVGVIPATAYHCTPTTRRVSSGAQPPCRSLRNVGRRAVAARPLHMTVQEDEHPSASLGKLATFLVTSAVILGTAVPGHAQDDIFSKLEQKLVRDPVPQWQSEEAVPEPQTPAAPVAAQPAPEPVVPEVAPPTPVLEPVAPSQVLDQVQGAASQVLESVQGAASQVLDQVQDAVSQIQPQQPVSPTVPQTESPAVPQTVSPAVPQNRPPAFFWKVGSPKFGEYKPQRPQYRTIEPSAPDLLKIKILPPDVEDEAQSSIEQFKAKLPKQQDFQKALDEIGRSVQDAVAPASQLPPLPTTPVTGTLQEVLPDDVPPDFALSVLLSLPLLAGLLQAAARNADPDALEEEGPAGRSMRTGFGVKPYTLRKPQTRTRSQTATLVPVGAGGNVAGPAVAAQPVPAAGGAQEGQREALQALQQEMRALREQLQRASQSSGQLSTKLEALEAENRRLGQQMQELGNLPDAQAALRQAEEAEERAALALEQERKAEARIRELKEREERMTAYQLKRSNDPQFQRQREKFVSRFESLQGGAASFGPALGAQVAAPPAAAAVKPLPHIEGAPKLYTPEPIKEPAVVTASVKGTARAPAPAKQKQPAKEEDTLVKKIQRGVKALQTPAGAAAAQPSTAPKKQPATEEDTLKVQKEKAPQTPTEAAAAQAPTAPKKQPATEEDTLKFKRWKAPQTPTEAAAAQAPTVPKKQPATEEDTLKIQREKALQTPTEAAAAEAPTEAAAAKAPTAPKKQPTTVEDTLKVQGEKAPQTPTDVAASRAPAAPKARSPARKRVADAPQAAATPVQAATAPVARNEAPVSRGSRGLPVRPATNAGGGGTAVLEQAPPAVEPKIVAGGERTAVTESPVNGAPDDSAWKALSPAQLKRKTVADMEQFLSARGLPTEPKRKAALLVQVEAYLERS